MTQASPIAILNGPKMQLAEFAKRTIERWTTAEQQFVARVENKFGLEIGGPSTAFSDTGEIRVYGAIAGLDNCVFSAETVWEGKRAEGQTYSFHPRKPNGFNFIREATNLVGIPDSRYDFILSSHNLEHVSNPVKALKEWTRVVKPGGAIIVLLPNYRRTFDHRRKPTRVAHMLEDYRQDIDETDLTHLDEILELHDLSRDLAAGSKDQFRERSLRNFENRCLHHHVFSKRNSRDLFKSVGLLVERIDIRRPNHIAILAGRPASMTADPKRTASPTTNA